MMIDGIPAPGPNLFLPKGHYWDDRQSDNPINQYQPISTEESSHAEWEIFNLLRGQKSSMDAESKIK
jgi:hypothetical protein